MSEVLRTISSLMEQAVATGVGEEAVRCVIIATDQASTFREWEAVVDGLSAIPTLPLALRRTVLARARAAAEDRKEIWGFRVVAIAEANDLDDPASARETLRAGERMLLAQANAERALGYEWGVLAEAHVLALADEAAARRCLSAGWALAWRRKDVENLGRLAARWSQVVDRDEGRGRLATVEHAARDWGDNAAADRVGPRGLRPEALRLRVTTLEGWDGSGSALFDVLRARISVESLRAISEADYGDDAEKHEEALLAMCTTGLLPLEMAWHPGEVVELTRWSSGEAVDHVARLLCCVLLCLASPGSEMLQNGPVLVESSLALGDDVPHLAERLLVWHYETQEADAPEALTTLLSLFLLHAARQPVDPLLARLLQAPCARGEAARGLREQLAGSLRADLWVKLIADILPRVRLAQPAIVPLLGQLGFAP